MKKTFSLLLLIVQAVFVYGQNLTDNLIAHYEFTNGSVTDLSGNGNNAINAGATPATGIANQTNEAFSLASGAHLKLPSGILLKSNVSISIWFKTGNSGGLIGYQNTATTTTPSQHVPIAYLGTDSRLKATFWSGIERNINGRNVNYVDNNWHHLVLTVKPGKQTVYIDGTVAGTLNQGHSILPAMTFCQIGRAFTKGWDNATNGWHNFFGSVDKVRIYDTELSASLVTDIYNLEVTGGTTTPLTTPDLLASYDFNNGAMIDSSTYERDAINSGASPATDRFGNMDQAISLNGSSHVKLPSSILLGTTRSLSVWFKTGSAGALLGYQNRAVGVTPSQHVPISFLKTDNKLSSSFWANNVDGNVTTTTNNYRDNTWHHLVLTTTSISQKLYVDNVLIGTLNEGHAVLPAMTFSQLGTAYTAGWNNTNNDWFNYTGSIDDVKIYKKELSASQVDSLFTLPNPSTITNIFNTQKETTLAFYPNPASTIIHTAEGKLEILDTMGNLLITTYSRGQVDVSSLTPGIYLVTQDNKKATLIIN